jgi:hypothetical protein
MYQAMYQAWKQYGEEVSRAYRRRLESKKPRQDESCKLPGCRC